jgi:hypothetical protein
VGMNVGELLCFVGVWKILKGLKISFE